LQNKEDQSISAGNCNFLIANIAFPNQNYNTGYTKDYHRKISASCCKCHVIWLCAAITVPLGTPSQGVDPQQLSYVEARLSSHDGVTPPPPDWQPRGLPTLLVWRWVPRSTPIPGQWHVHRHGTTGYHPMTQQYWYSVINYVHHSLLVVYIQLLITYGVQILRLMLLLLSSFDTLSYFNVAEYKH
jgi:hypothetical protein